MVQGDHFICKPPSERHVCLQRMCSRRFPAVDRWQHHADNRMLLLNIMPLVLFLDEVQNFIGLQSHDITVVRFQILTASSVKMRESLLGKAPCSPFGVDRRFRDAYCLHHQCDECTSETSVYYNETTRRYIPEYSHLRITVICADSCNL
jgi:hypothetical protein